MAEKKRCAIYTRKSTEEGLEQDFNSLDAQREACVAYILSQAAEGWEQVDEHYDDGGWSGGKIERPALTQLLADIEAGKVDIIVVYKVDRLTRSLADFAKIVDILDAKEASFVSVTQAFNTTNSMGRLTLNVLLSFAQFEREVTGERIRDKIAASKKKGMWMGGPVPIGYCLQDRQLLVEPEEAAIVRIIFERYRAMRSIGQLADELAGIGVRTKLRTHKSGKTVGGIAFTKGPLANLLKNPVYTGRVRHKDKLYDGQHEAIIEQALWDEVQAIFKANGQDRKLGKKANNPSLLTGRLTDPDGRPMTPVHTSKGSKRYRYYVTRTNAGDSDGDQWRVAAGELDRAAVRLVGQWLRLPDGDMQGADVEVRQALASEYPDMTITEQRKILIDRDLRFALSDEAISVAGAANDQTQCVSLPARLVKQGHERKLTLSPDGKSVAEPNPVLLKLLAQARAAQRMVLNGTEESSVAHYGKRHLWQLLRISWLAPDIVSAIVDGNQPPNLTGRRLLRAAALPLDWAEQRQYLGFS
jgi:site-specific DNA recombinase